MAKRDYYEVLGVDRSAELDEIKKAYRKLAVRYHPDRNAGDTQAEERFKEATEAYDVLANPQKRQAYDQFGFAGVDGMAGGQGHDYSHVFRDFEDVFGDVSSIFDSFFTRTDRRRGGGRGGGAGRGDDLRYDLRIPFEQAVFGTKADVAYRRQEACSRCDGSGTEGTTARSICPTCGGSGQVRRNSGFFSIATSCPSCGGEGEVIENPCRACRGTGREQKERRLRVTIPVGMENGKRIQLTGQGDAGIGRAPAGDLYVFVHVEPHPCYQRHGDDLYCVIPLAFTQAALGTSILVRTLDDRRIRVKVPAGTQPGKLLRVRGEGVPHPDNPGRRGDLYIKVAVTVPDRLSSHARKLLGEVAEAVGEESSPEPVPLAELE